MPPVVNFHFKALSVLYLTLAIRQECRCGALFQLALIRSTGENAKQTCYCPHCKEQYAFEAAGVIDQQLIRLSNAGTRIDLDPARIFNIAEAKGARYLHHANTAATSCTFIEQGALLSREQVEVRGLKQTPQFTDKVDKLWGIYNDVFMDLVDIHQHASNYIHYGPVIFRFPLGILKKYPFQSVKVTKKNPSDWTYKDKIGDRYYTSEEEFEAGYRLGNFGSMLIFSKIAGEMPLAGNLEGFIIDKCELVWTDTEVALDETVIKRIKTLIAGGLLSAAHIYRRRCRKPECGCVQTYEDMYAPVIEKLFRP